MKKFLDGFRQFKSNILLHGYLFKWGTFYDSPLFATWWDNLSKPD